MIRAGERGAGLDIVFDPAGSPAGTYGLGSIPARCPYKAGDWVQLHGYPGYPPGHQREGFRGYVLGGLGGTLIRGLTDDGREWSEHWGHLVPDGERDSDGFLRCACCPPWTRRRTVKVCVGQLDLFGAAS